MVVNKNQFATRAFTWPQGEGVKIVFQSEKGRNIQLTANGQWAWFRLLNSMDLKTTENPKEYEVVFQKGIYSIELRLMAENLVNPYVPNILQAFRCPASLLRD